MENNQQETGNNKKSEKKETSFIRELIKDIIIAVVIVLAITAVIKPTIVKETSMLDTLQENNYLFVYKLAYMGDKSPERGDIIVFQSDLVDEETGKEMLLIKRVIGIEGDIVSFEDNKVYVNGEAIKEDYIYDEPAEYRSYPNGESFTVGDDEVFAMGDHRSVSRDSRAPEVGNVDEDTIVGKAIFRVYPFNEMGTL